MAKDPKDIKQAYDGRFDDVSAAVFVVLPPDGRIVSCNVEAEELTGYERHELEGMHLATIFREEDRSRVESIFRSSASLEFGKLFEHNVIVRKRSRRKIIVDMGFRRACQDGVDALVFTLQDITELKTNEERVIRSHEYVTNVVNSIVELLVVVDEHNVIERINTAVSGITGYDESELVGHHVSRLFPGLYQQHGGTGEVDPNYAEIETHVHTKKEGPVSVLVSRSEVRDPRDAGKAVLVAMDISERKRSERLIGEQQMMLVQASKMSSLGEMASSIAHEINNPLTVVLGRCEILQMQHEANGAGNPEMLKGVELIDKMSKRILKIVRGLQALSRDQRHDAMEIVNLSDVLRETLALCEQRIKMGVSDFRTPDLTDPIWVKCRPTQISQAILNLLNNSYDAISTQPNNWIQLEVNRQSQALQIVVMDSGPGLTDAVREKLFTPFFTTKPVGKGTGIGLSVSRSLIESHGGTLELDAAHKNTRFVILLPTAQEAKHAG